MSFSTAQIRQLQRDVKASDIRTREVNGRELAYIEGWHAIAEANRIFGFDGWSRETIETRCVLSREVRGTFHTLYTVKVRISVRADGETVIREGFGTGEAQAPAPGEAHDKAIKTAETDATKRAFATFGKPFGLSLYLGHRKTKPKTSKTPEIQRRRTLQRMAPNGRYYVVPRSKQPPLDWVVPGQSIPIPSQDLSQTPAIEPSANGDRLWDTASGQQAQHSATIAKALPVDENRRDVTPVTSNLTSDVLVTPDQGNPDILATDYASPSLLIDRPRRRRDKEHLKYVASQPCLVCDRTPSDAHHLKFVQPAALALKVSDEFTVPLCRTHHRQLHQAGREAEWWIDMDIDPLPIANDLWRESKSAKVKVGNDE